MTFSRSELVQETGVLRNQHTLLTVFHPIFHFACFLQSLSYNVNLKRRDYHHTLRTTRSQLQEAPQYLHQDWQSQSGKKNTKQTETNKNRKRNTFIFHTGKSTYRTIRNISCARLTNCAHITQIQTKVTEHPVINKGVQTQLLQVNVFKTEQNNPFSASFYSFKKKGKIKQNRDLCSLGDQN